MTSERKQEANRRNAQRSTGPRTVEGKVASARNSLRHGLRAERLLLETEDAQEYEALRAGLLEALGPEGAMEELLVERIVACAWRLRRACELESTALQQEMDEVRDLPSFARQPQTDRAVLSLAYVRTINMGSIPANLARYETTLERGLYRAHHELQRMQQERGARESAPVAVDVTLDVTSGAQRALEE